MAAATTAGALASAAGPAHAGDNICTAGIDDVAAPEGDAGTSDFTFTVTLTGVPAPFDVHYTTAPVTATPDTDYTPEEGDVSLGPAATTAQITIPVVGDAAVEPAETFVVNISSSDTTCVITKNQGTGTIQNDDSGQPASVPRGYRLTGIDGGVFNYGESQHKGAAAAIEDLAAPIVDIEETPDRSGYWQTGLDGGVFAWDAPFYGSMGGTPLNAPISAMAPRPQGDGYWLVGFDGGVFSFGNAGFHGSLGSIDLAAPIIGIVATADGGGYWLLGGDGGVFAFGNAAFHGSPVNDGGSEMGIVAMWPTPDGGGYWLTTFLGEILTFGNASEHGDIDNPRDLNAPVLDVRGLADGSGYWLSALDGGVFAFDAPFYGSPAGIPPAFPVIAMAGKR